MLDVMLLSEVTDFITKLSAYPENTPIDDGLINQLIERFAHLDQEHLNEDDFIFINDIFETRGKQIIDTELDYTRVNHGINSLWIDWARQLAQANADLSLIHLLFPTVIDKKDPNGLNSIEYDSDDAARDKAELDCKNLYLGPDNESLYTIRNFLAHLLKYPLSTYRKNFTQLFPISLVELSRFRQGAGHRFLIDNSAYNNLWEYLSQKVFPHLQHYGDIPITVLPPFLELMTTYFEMKAACTDFSEFKKKFRHWLGCLYECSVSEVNQLYGVKIALSGKNYYLLELLIDIHEAKTFVLDEHFAAIAQWLNKYNPSYVVEHQALDFLYQEMDSGKHLSQTLLKRLIEKCASDYTVDDQITEKMAILLSDIESTASLQKRMIEQLRDIYTLRWAKVLDTPLDYLRLQTHANESWIRLAQYLAGSNRIHSNYYQFLMPTIQNSQEDVFDCPVTDYPLSHYVLSEDKSRLILLDVCVSHYRSKGTFRYWKDEQWMSLSAIEIERVQYAAKAFASYYQDQLSKQRHPSVSLTTVKAIKTLIDGCLYPKGLNFGNEYNASELQEAERAVLAFADYYLSLEQDEQDVLKQQIIIYRGERKTFESLWEGAVINRECIALFGFFLMQLVLNYAPAWRFSAKIEEKLSKDIALMRENSTHQVFSDYNNLSKKDAERRCQLIFLSLMTHSFKMRLFCGKPLEFWDCENSVHGVAKQIFDHLIPMIQNKDFRNSRFVYAQIMESIIKPALAAKPFSVRVTSSDTFNRWLIDIKEVKLFSREFKYYEPEQLLQFLLSLDAKPDFSNFRFKNIISQLIRTCAQEKHALDKKLRANIILIKFISSFEMNQAEQLLDAMSDFNYPVRHVDIYRDVRNFIVGEMENLKQNSHESGRFFSAGKQEKSTSTVFSSEQNEASTPASIKEIIDSLKRGLYKSSALSTAEIHKNTVYLRSLEAPILTQQESRAKLIAEEEDYFSNIMS